MNSLEEKAHSSAHLISIMMHCLYSIRDSLIALKYGDHEDYKAVNDKMCSDCHVDDALYEKFNSTRCYFRFKFGVRNCLVA